MYLSTRGCDLFSEISFSTIETGSSTFDSLDFSFRPPRPMESARQLIPVPEFAF